MAEAAANLGIVQSDLGHTQEALASFRQARAAALQRCIITENLRSFVNFLAALGPGCRVTNV